MTIIAKRPAICVASRRNCCENSDTLATSPNAFNKITNTYTIFQVILILVYSRYNFCHGKDHIWLVLCRKWQLVSIQWCALQLTVHARALNMIYWVFFSNAVNGEVPQITVILSKCQVRLKWWIGLSLCPDLSNNRDSEKWFSER